MDTFAPSPALPFQLTVNVPRFRTFLYHLAAWLLYYLYEIGFLMVMDLPFPHPLESFLHFSVFAILFYCHSEGLFPRFFITQRYGAYALGLVGLATVFVGLRYIVTVPLLTDYLQIKILYNFPGLRLFLAFSMYRGMLYYTYSLAYAYTSYALSFQKQLREQEQQLRVQERGLLEADIALLRSQINPHFLFNALNFLYAQIYPLSEPTAKSVLLLSDIMRYSLNEGGEQGKVPLDKEIQHLRNFVTINQLRFGHKLQVQLEVQGNTQFLLILPLVLITFVENCFKHGELFDPAHPVLVQVRVQENQLTFFASNRKHSGPVEHSTGIGLENTRRRLAAIYPNRHLLTVSDTPEFYAIHLNMSL